MAPCIRVNSESTRHSITSAFRCGDRQRRALCAITPSVQSAWEIKLKKAF
ncbi:hypothetical protein [Calothrix rhizosoleniae]|nr:hypothetical protein [Calothrix rhizosoleniae]